MPMTPDEADVHKYEASERTSRAITQWLVMGGCIMVVTIAAGMLIDSIDDHGAKIAIEHAKVLEEQSSAAKARAEADKAMWEHMQVKP